MKSKSPAILAAALLLAPLPFLMAAPPEPVSMPGIITGKMDISFNSRTVLGADGKPAKGAFDVYDLAMNVAQTTEFTGKIMRQPLITGDVLGRTIQPGQISYSIDLAVLNPSNLSQKKVVGKWAGTVPVSATGEYQFDGSPESPLRFAIDAVGKAPAFTDKFGGKLVGKGRKTTGVMSYVRQFRGKEVRVEVKNSDPMRFDSVILAAGPSQNYPRTVVSGNLDYDYETGNWLTSGIRFKYSYDGADVEDIVTGSIKWVEDPNRDSNGRGHYEFNLRFNESKNTGGGGTEADAFASLSDEEAFFAVDNSIPSLTGTIKYEDSFTGSGDKRVPATSKVTYNLDANRITKQQAVNFFKLWLLAIGPTNDE